MRSNVFSLLSILIISLATQFAPAAWSQSAVDEDFHIQGEYVGNVKGDYTGLQVVAMGDGKFNAVLCEGGLPGAGWDQANKRQLSGRRDDQGVTLAGQDLYAIRLSPDGSQWRASVDRNGRTVGSLRKIYRISPTIGARPTAGAVVLFDGSLTEHLENATVTDDGLINVVNSKGGFSTVDPVGDFRLHAEFQTPYEPNKRGQGRGNSGFYLQRRYEVQVLDSFGLEGVENECGALYRQKRPDVNMAFPPLSWQTYDIFFTAARFDEEGNRTAAARITVVHNGVKVHDDYEIVNKTGAGRKEGPEPMPILWQNHSNAVHYRNIWIVHDPESMDLEECQRRRLRLSIRRFGRRR